MTTENRAWAENLIKKVDPAFRHRWDIYNDILLHSLTLQAVWIDLGCGDNRMIEGFGHLAGKAIGVDIEIWSERKKDLLLANAQALPFSDASADLVTLRFVVEHFDEVEKYFSEIDRILKPGGKALIMTTNTLSPIIFIPRFLLPFSLKQRILTKLFKVESDDVLPTYHKMNSPKKFIDVSKNLVLEQMYFVSDLNWARRWMFRILLFWHRLTRPERLHKFRSNILAVLVKK